MIEHNVLADEQSGFSIDPVLQRRYQFASGVELLQLFETKIAALLQKVTDQQNALVLEIHVPIFPTSLLNLCLAEPRRHISSAVLHRRPFQTKVRAVLRCSLWLSY